MKRLTVGGRLAIVNAAVVAGAMLAIGGVLFALGESALVHGADGLLRGELEEVAAALRGQPLTAESLSALVRAEGAEHATESLAFRVTGGGGEGIARSESGAWGALPPPQGPEDRFRSARTVRVPGSGARHRVLARRVPSNSFGPVVLEASMGLHAADAALAELREVSLLLAPALLLVALAAGYLLARGALRPVGAMEEAARGIGAAPPGERLPRTGNGDEIDRLAGTLNAMLGRIEEASARNLRFAGDVAHEVRTPLATIRAQLEAMPGGGEPVEAAVREVERMEAMVRSLLLVCRADEGPAASGGPPVDLGAVAARVAEFFAPAAAARGIRVAADLPSDLGVRGDADSLERALANLVDNALHASDAGGEVEIRGERNGSAVRIEVLDRGCGVPEEVRARVFERFFRAAGARARHPAGSGLGLALVRAVARSHGGDATYAPRAGGGSAFGIDLPPA